MKQFLIDQYTYNYDTDAWFVALGNTIKNLSAEQAAWKPDGADNSIWGIIRHLNLYNERYLRRFGGETVEAADIENSETFAGAAEVERFDLVMNGWRTAFEAETEEKFLEIYDKENQTTWAETVGLINTHNAYHGGLIVLLRKLQGSWDWSKGVS